MDEIYAWHEQDIPVDVYCGRADHYFSAGNIAFNQITDIKATIFCTACSEALPPSVNF